MEKKADKALKKNEQRTKKRSFATPILLIAAGLLAIGTAFCAISVSSINRNEIVKEAERQTIIKSGTFHAGITVNGISISGMTIDEAKTALLPVEATLTDSVHFNLKYETNTYEITKDDFTISYNTDALLNEAIMLGRDGGLLKLQHNLDNYHNAGKAYEIEYVVDAASFSDKLELLLSDIAVPPVDAALKIKSGSINYSSVIDNFPFTVSDGKNGIAIDMESLNSDLLTKMKNGEFGDVEIPTVIVEPEITSDDIRGTAVLRAVFHTDFGSSSANRKANVRKAADLCNKTVLQPGDVFSCNDTMGARTEGRGWLPAPAVVDGGARTENQAGGGVCQVSTTMYDCVVMSDLQIVYRQNHSAQSTYVDGGLDATINTGTIDFTWKNNTNHPVFLFMWTSGGTLYSAIYAEPFPSSFDSVKFTSELIKTIEPPAEAKYITKGALPTGYWILRNDSKSGYKYASYKKYYNGNRLFDTKHVADSIYPAQQKAFYVWPGFNPGDYLDPAKQVKMDKDGNLTFPGVPSTPAPSIPPAPTEPGFVTPTPIPPAPTGNP
ncbi:MAG: VanW family protein [Clostridia bacterium]